MSSPEPGADLNARVVETLLHLSLSSGTVLDPEQHARQALARLVKLFRCDRGLLFLPDANNRLRVAAAYRLGHFVAIDQPYSRSVVRQVAEAMEVVRIPDALTDPRVQDRTSVVESGLRSIIAVPMLAQSRLVGVLYLDNRLACGLFREGDLGAVCALANHLAQALETARAAQLESHLEAERRERELADILRETAVSLTASLEPGRLLDCLLQGLARVVPYDSSKSYLVDDSLPPDWARGCLESGSAVSHHSSLCLPLLREGHPVGALRLTREAGPFGEHEAGLALVFASQAGMALENARLFARVQELASVDQLTGVWNRRHLMDLAEQAMKGARRTQRGLTLILLDIDHFKKFNDEHGHQLGDSVLRAVAQVCRQTLRESDIFGRYGGEEFMVVLPETGPEGAAQTAERLGTAIRGMALQTEQGQPLQVTISQGLSCSPPEELQTLLRLADEALYAAKAAGRNCFRIA